MSLNLFPARVAIGRFRGADGIDVDVLASPEFVRALSALFERVGGANGMSNDDLALLAAFAPPAMAPDHDIDFQFAPTLASASFSGDEIPAAVFVPQSAALDLGIIHAAPSNDALLAQLARQMEELRLHVEAISSGRVELAQLRSYAQELEIQYSFVMPGTDWEHPGNIGSKTPNTGAFTTLTASAAVALSPANANVVMSPSGTGLVTISPATAGSIENMALGIATPKAARVTTINLLTLTQPATGSTLTITDGKTLAVNRNITLTGTDGTTWTGPATSFSVARIDAAQTFAGTQTFTGLKIQDFVTAATAKNQYTINVNGSNYAVFYDVGLSSSNGGLAIGGSGTTTGVPSVPTMFWNVNNGNVVIGSTTDGMTTGGSLAVEKDLAHRGAKAGFYNIAPVAKPTVSGSRGANAALASAITALSNLGLITDSSTV